MNVDRPHLNRYIADSRLPRGAENFVGRGEEISKLNGWWQSHGVKVVQIVAWGGVGKTSLVVDWVSQYSGNNWQGVDAYFDWSFYDQGTRQQGFAKSGAFIDEALRHFGDEDKANTAAPPEDKAKRLAELLIERRTLLILDGVETLQNPPGSNRDPGRLADAAIETLLRSLAFKPNHGLCVITTRYKLKGLEGHQGHTFETIDLDKLSTQRGAELLYLSGARFAGETEIKPDDSALLEASDWAHGHALTLTVLGSFLKQAHHGDIRARDVVKLKKVAEQNENQRLFAVMESYESWMRQVGDNGMRQLAILRLLGLFDRPADPKWLNALRAPPAIQGLTEPVVRHGRQDDPHWNIALTNLEGLGLLSRGRNVRKTFGTYDAANAPIDTHPLIREYFADQLQVHHPDAWQKAHARLYKCLADKSAGLPETLEDMEPWFAAVDHGCRADLYREAYHDVYLRCISRGSDHYSKDKLGAVQEELAALANFIKEPWTTPVDKLAPKDQANVLIEVGIVLRLGGRASDAEQSLLAAIDIAQKANLPAEEAKARRHLAQLLLDMGRSDDAVGHAENAVAKAESASDTSQEISALTTLADIYHQLDDVDHTATYFSRAADLQRQHDPEHPLLHRLASYRFCDFLISQQRYDDTLAHVEATRDYPKQKKFEAALALDRITEARVFCLDETRRDLNRALRLVEKAVVDLENSGQQQLHVRGLLASAEVRRICAEQIGGSGSEEIQRAIEDVKRALAIASRNGMRLQMADCYLEFTRCQLLLNDIQAAQLSFKRVEELVNGIGYRRRAFAINELTETLKKLAVVLEEQLDQPSSRISAVTDTKRADSKNHRTITWLHLSDLHMCEPRNGWDIHVVLQPLLADLQDLERDHGLRPDLVFFTGDLAFGQIGDGVGESIAEQFCAGHDFLERVRSAFSPEVSQENVFIVPGNHDVIRSEVALDQISWLDRDCDIDSITSIILSGNIQWKRYLERLSAYRKFLSDYGYYHLLGDPDRLIYAIQRSVSGVSVGIAGLNSAWSCCRSDERGRLWLAGDWQTRTLLRELHNAKIKIALLHHPFDWFREPDATPVCRSIEQRFRFCLHGHEHEAWVTSLADGDHTRIAAAACYDRSDRKNGYNFVRIDLDACTAEVWLRKYESIGGGWTPCIIFCKTDIYGVWSLRLDWLK